MQNRTHVDTFLHARLYYSNPLAAFSKTLLLDAIGQAGPKQIIMTYICSYAYGKIKTSSQAIVVLL